jgi:NADH-quinone oxidoreductase subunit N
MNWGDVLLAMLPEHILLIGIVLLIVIELVSDRARGALALAIVTVAASTAVAAALATNGYSSAPFAGQFSVNPATLTAKAIVLALVLPTLLLSRDEFRETRFHILLLSSVYGVCLLLSADSFLTMFLGLELMSLPVYVLVLLGFQRPEGPEAALKYLVLGGAATATFLMGVSLLYGGTGTLELSAFSRALGSSNTMAQAAVVLIVVAFFVKAAIVPFHAWAPDAYEGASVPVTAYMSTVIKAGVLLAAVRLFSTTPVVRPMADLLAILPLASMVWGNLAAIRQTSFRRMIAYSSIAHAGYLFFAFLGDGAARFEAVVFYILAYGLMNLLAFASLPRGEDDAISDRLTSLKGMYQRRPFAALMLGLSMLSLAGIPPLPGFIAKFLIFKNVIASGYTVYAVLGLIGSYLGIYFYLRVIQYAFMSPDAIVEPANQRRLALSASVLCLAPAGLMAVFPGWFMAQL